MKAFKCDVCRRYFLGDPDGNASFSVKEGILTDYDLCKVCLNYLHQAIRAKASAQ